jgi:hypothetical protein
VSTVIQAGVVDWLSIEKGSGHVVLTVVDDQDWSDEVGHLLALQEKLNNYLAFIESGEVFECLVETVGRTVARTMPMKVSIVAKYDMTFQAKQFLEYAKGTFRGAGFELVFELVRAPS